MEKFAGYGFNKSHAAAYSLLAYHTGWLKVHYTAEFFCANMTVEMDDTDKLKVLFEDAQQELRHHLRAAGREPRQLPLRADHRTRSIRYGLGAVKGTGQQAIEAIVAAREEGGPFTSLYDFCVRVDRTRINKRTVEALIKAGAFDSLQLNRASLVGVDRPRLRLRQRDRGQRQPGRPVRHGRLARRQHAGAATWSRPCPGA